MTYGMYAYGMYAYGMYDYGMYYCFEIMNGDQDRVVQLEEN